MEMRKHMHGPSVELRREVVERSPGLDSEQGLEELLDTIEARLGADAEVMDVEDPESILTGALGWASVVSEALARYSAPTSPFRQTLAGWGEGIGRHLARIVEILRRPLELAARALHALSFTIGVSFPWGVSVSLSWP